MDDAPESSDLDPSKFNWVGWLLLVGTFAVFFFGSGLMMMALTAAGRGQPPNRWIWRLCGVLLIATCLGIFFGGQRLLHRFGISIVRPESPPK